MAAYEFMYVTPGIQNLIRENKSFRIDSEIQTGKRSACSCWTTTSG
jgi:twitching motility protein PilT